MVRPSSCPTKTNRLAVHDKDSLRRDSLNLSSQAFALACLADEKAQDRKVSEDHKNKEILDLRQGMDRLQVEINLHQKFEHLYTEKT